jgi:hypothetical protein
MQTPVRTDLLEWVEIPDRSQIFQSKLKLEMLQFKKYGRLLASCSSSNMRDLVEYSFLRGLFEKEIEYFASFHIRNRN